MKQAELILELTNPYIKEQMEGVQRASASARIVYVDGNRSESQSHFEFTAPTGPIEAEELSWYLESYHVWPTGVFENRAKSVESQLPEWGNALYRQMADSKEGLQILQKWTNSEKPRSFTVSVNPTGDLSNAAAELLSLPWELLHDSKDFLFQNENPVQIRRKIEGIQTEEIKIADLPVRILLVSPRPEGFGIGYIDHRISSIPLVEAIENLGESVKLTILTPPTLKAFRQELYSASKKGTPYHVVHFDGHGSYENGQGFLFFEDPNDADKTRDRGSERVPAQEIASIMKQLSPPFLKGDLGGLPKNSQFRVPLFFLEACQTATADKDPTTSTAGTLIQNGIPAVVAMSHSVLVETARRFVIDFYKSLVTGKTVSEAAASGQCALKKDAYRFRIFGAGSLHLQDWFVPVLFQNRDVHLFKGIDRIQQPEPAANKTANLPPSPEHTFIGRSRELLALERLLSLKPWAALTGIGGEGKTTIAVEFARWLVRSQRMDRAVFVSVEHYTDARILLDALGSQLVDGYTVAKYKDEELLTEAVKPIEQAMQQRKTIVVIDNMESILPPPDYDESTKDDYANLLYDPESLGKLFELCRKLLTAGSARIVFTSREFMPEPFNDGGNYVSISRIDKDEAVLLVQEVMAKKGLKPLEDEKGNPPDIEALVEAVDCHARSLTLLAPEISRLGVEKTRENVVELMKEMEQRFTGEREKSLLASVELSLRRLKPQTREKIRALAVFHGGFHPFVLSVTLQIEQEEAYAIGNKLIRIGLGEAKEHGYISLHPALSFYLDQELEPEQRRVFQTLWADGMKQFSDFLYEQCSQDTRVAAVLTLHDLPNLMALLDFLTAQDNAEETVNFAGMLEDLLRYLGSPHILARVSAVRQREAEKIGQWSNVAFNAARVHIDRLIESGALQEAKMDAKALLKKSLDAGDSAYQGADYDIAIAYWLLGSALKMGGSFQRALGAIEKAYKLFYVMGENGNKGAAKMAPVSLSEKGDCLRYLGRLDESAAAYENVIKIAEALNFTRQAAVGRGQLGTVRIFQGRFPEALDAHKAALKTFEALQDPESVAVAHHQIGIIYEQSGNLDMAEKAYKKSLEIRVQKKLEADRAASLGQLGNLYKKMGRLEDAAVFYSQAADIDVKLNDTANEGIDRNNLAGTLIMLKRYNQARKELQRAIECKEPYGHAAQLWVTWGIRQDLETAEGNMEATAQARNKAIELYLSYLRAGGENRNPGERLCAMFRQAVAENQTDWFKAVLTNVAGDARYGVSMRKLASALSGILSGVRDKSVVEDMELWYDDAAEILLLLEEMG